MQANPLASLENASSDVGTRLQTNKTSTRTWRSHPCHPTQRSGQSLTSLSIKSSAAVFRRKSCELATPLCFVAGPSALISSLPSSSWVLGSLQSPSLSFLLAPHHSSQENQERKRLWEVGIWSSPGGNSGIRREPVRAEEAATRGCVPALQALQCKTTKTPTHGCFSPCLSSPSAVSTSAMGTVEPCSPYG